MRPPSGRKTGIRQLKRFFSVFAAAGAIMLTGLGSASAQQSQDELRATHGDWEIRCSPGTDTCASVELHDRFCWDREIQIRATNLGFLLRC